jgi:hypothetical protein
MGLKPIAMEKKKIILSAISPGISAFGFQLTLTGEFLILIFIFKPLIL